MKHTPVLVQEVCEAIPDLPEITFFDGTFGFGGHYQEISKYLGDRLKTYYGLDQDPKTLEVAKETYEDSKLNLQLGLFQNFEKYIPVESQINVFFLDLGVNTPQLKSGERGLSVYEDGPLDFRLSPKFHSKTAVNLLRDMSLKDISEAIRLMTSLTGSRNIAAALKDFVQPGNGPFTTQRLLLKLKPFLRYKKHHVHPATSLFMMLRILVNQEMEALESVIINAIKHLPPEGRLIVISFHGLEHRLVKQLLGTQTAYGKILNRKAIIASPEEIEKNPSARSAQLRVFEKSEVAI
jgi:16S rRNA (cytosine1402-N4)-methyltransferase